MTGEDQSGGRLAAWKQKLQRLLGLDRAIAYTVLARVCGIIGSTGTVLLIVRFMGRVEQGYYYVLLSLISLRMVFELGATLVIIQMAAHECVHLSFGPDGTVEGDSVALDRLASILQKTIRWFSATSALMAATLLPAGFYFLSIHNAHGVDVPWQWPWVLAVLATALLLAIDSVVFFVEGCGQVRQVAGMRVGQAVAGGLLAWAFIAMKQGLFAPGIVNISFSIVGAIFLFRRRVLLGTLLRRAKSCIPISWKAEVWPFQWRLGISTLCGYCTLQALTPIVFAARGPVEAGQIGMSISIVSYLGVLALAWMSTKAPAFGNLVAQRDYLGLDRLFFGTLRRSLPLLTAMVAACEVLLIVLSRTFPHIAARLVSPEVFAILLVAALGNHVMQSEGLYLRAFKREPFLIQSIIVSSVTVVLCVLLVRLWGNAGVALSYIVGVGAVGAISATIIFQAWRRGLDRSGSSQNAACTIGKAS